MSDTAQAIHHPVIAEAHCWVDATPFRAWLRQLLSDTGLPWRVLARAARVSPTVVHRLLEQQPNRPLPRLRQLDAKRLLDLRSAGIRRLAVEPTACEPLRMLAWALGLRGASPAEIATFIGTDIIATRSLMAGNPICCTKLMQLRAEAACQAWGVDPDELLRSQPGHAVGRR